MLTKENDLYIIFKIVDEVEPTCIIDVDMALARAGMISRGLMNEAIPSDVTLISIVTGKIQDALEKKAMEFPVYNSVYDGVLSVENCPSQDVQSLLLSLGTTPDDKDVAHIRPRCILTDNADWVKKVFGDDYEVTDINIDNDKYFFANRLINTCNMPI